MIGMIVVGHGEFSKGVNSVIELVAGKQEYFELVSFLQSDSSETLRENLKKALEKLDTKETIIFTDIPGGTPFKESVMLGAENGGIEVIAGTNIPMILEILFNRSEGTIAEVTAQAVQVGKAQILSFEMEEPEEDDFGEGI